jgi:hypothetical protein
MSRCHSLNIALNVSHKDTLSKGKIITIAASNDVNMLSTYKKQGR